jgi:hypothetical protein
MPRSLVEVGSIQDQVTANTVQVTGTTTTSNMTEKVVIDRLARPGSGVLTLDVAKGTFFHFTKTASDDFQFNFINSSTNMPSELVSSGRILTIAVMINNGSTAYRLNDASINDATIKDIVLWNGGNGAPAEGTTNAADLFVFTFIKDHTNSTKVLASAKSSGGSFGVSAQGPITPGQAAYVSPGTYTWTAPADVWKVSVLAVGGGGGGQNSWANPGGAGAGLGWKNDILVEPGADYTVVVGAGGGNGVNGGTSYFIDTSTVAGYGGGSASGQTGGPNGNGRGGGYTGDGGGAGGNATDWTGGGGAGGYTAAGGTPGGNGSGGGAAGGNPYSSTYGTGAGGGVGLQGAGPSGSGFYTPWNSSGSPGGGGNGGSGGERGMYGQNPWSGTGESSNNIRGGNYGGGGGGPGTSWPSSSGDGGLGGVRILWGTTTERAWPATNTGDL